MAGVLFFATMISYAMVYLTNIALNIPLTSAASVIMMAPVLLVYLIFQKHMIKALTIGAVKE